MEIKVLGPGCKNCKALDDAVRKVVEELGIEATVEKVEDPRKIADHGVMLTPGLVINGKVKCAGRLPKNEEIKNWLQSITGGCSE